MLLTLKFHIDRKKDGRLIFTCPHCGLGMASFTGRPTSCEDCNGALPNFVGLQHDQRVRKLYHLEGFLATWRARSTEEKNGHSQR